MQRELWGCSGSYMNAVGAGEAAGVGDAAGAGDEEGEGVTAIDWNVSPH